MLASIRIFLMQDTLLDKTLAVLQHATDARPHKASGACPSVYNNIEQYMDCSAIKILHLSSVGNVSPRSWAATSGFFSKSLHETSRPFTQKMFRLHPVIYRAQVQMKVFAAEDMNVHAGLHGPQTTWLFSCRAHQDRDQECHINRGNQ